jgi:hypothetical protein
VTLKIGALAERTGTNAPTIRYYEQIGLLPRADRRDGGQRTYGKEDARRLTVELRGVEPPLDPARLRFIASPDTHLCGALLPQRAAYG